MKGLVAGLAVGLLIGIPAAGGTTLDTKHPAHERAERFVCEHPKHAERAHGLIIMPEAC